MARSKTRTSRRCVRAARRPARLIQEEDPEPLMEEVEEPLDQEPVVEQDDDEDAEEVFNDFVGNDGCEMRVLMCRSLAQRKRVTKSIT